MYDLPDADAASQLDEHNYLFWAILIESLLVVRGHWDVVDGSYPQPATTLKDEYHQWRMMDRRAWCDITAFCSPEHWWWYKPETAKELWDRLKETKKPYLPIFSFNISSPPIRQLPILSFNIFSSPIRLPGNPLRSNLYAHPARQLALPAPTIGKNQPPFLSAIRRPERVAPIAVSHPATRIKTSTPPPVAPANTSTCGLKYRCFHTMMPVTSPEATQPLQQGLKIPSHNPRRLRNAPPDSRTLLIMPNRLTLPTSPRPDEGEDLLHISTPL